MEEDKVEEVIPPPKIEEDSDEESGEDEADQSTLENGLLNACRENNTEESIMYLNKKNSFPMFEKDNWTPLLWAACNGNEELVEILLKVGAGAPYLPKEEDAADTLGLGGNEEGDHDPFVKPPDARKQGRYTPLHWSSYKGHYELVCKFLRAGMSPLDIDMYGNTAVHQAAAAGHLSILKCFLSRGVDVDVKNARLHTPMDLATEPETKKLIARATKSTRCADDTCRSKFDFKNIRYYCNKSEAFFCIRSCKTYWVAEHWNSTHDERPICRCTRVGELVEKHEKALRAALEAREFSAMDQALTASAAVDVDSRLRHSAQSLHEKLGQELKITKFLEAKDHHENYKDIRNDVEQVNNFVKAAEDLEIELDEALVAQVNAFTSRLISERNLRKQRELYLDGIRSCEQGHVDKLEGLIEDASKNAVEPEYIKSAETLTGQMRGNIRARETLVMLADYPERVYPEAEDPNAKKDKKGAPKKKKKREPAFPTPAWAEEISAVVDKVREMEQLSGDRRNLHLDEAFVGNVNTQLSRFKKEIAYRKQLDEEARLEAELRAQKKKQKKKA